MKKDSEVVSPSELQLQIIKDHQEIEGSENFTFFPESDGKTVIMIHNNTMEMTYIKLNANKNPNDLLKLMVNENDCEMDDTDKLINFIKYDGRNIVDCLIDFVKKYEKARSHLQDIYVGKDHKYLQERDDSRAVYGKAYIKEYNYLLVSIFSPVQVSIDDWSGECDVDLGGIIAEVSNVQSNEVKDAERLAREYVKMDIPFAKNWVGSYNSLKKYLIKNRERLALEEKNKRKKIKKEKKEENEKNEKKIAQLKITPEYPYGSVVCDENPFGKDNIDNLFKRLEFIPDEEMPELYEKLKKYDDYITTSQIASQIAELDLTNPRTVSRLKFLGWT